MSGDWGIINDIQKMCINDGPGFRTTVFLKGCLLDCKWCHNPEGKRRYPEVIPHTSNCDGCGKCLAVCPTGAVTLNEQKKPVIDHGLCTSCFQCEHACESGGLVIWGAVMGRDEVMEIVFEDKPFYKNSGGGLTVSGGEPMAQSDFVQSLFTACKADADENERIHTALDTCGHAPWASYEKVLPLTDLVLLDIKHLSSEAHKDYTGTGNGLVLENAQKISRMGIPMRVRVPVIPRVNDSEENFSRTAAFCGQLGDALLGVDLLPYHPYAGGKYKVFGMDYDFPAGQGYDDASLAPVVNIFLDHVKEVTIGG